MTGVQTCALPISSGGATAAVKEKSGVAVEKEAGSQGYQETPHVRDYYKTAQF